MGKKVDVTWKAECEREYCEKLAKGTGGAVRAGWIPHVVMGNMCEQQPNHKIAGVEHWGPSGKWGLARPACLVTMPVIAQKPEITWLAVSEIANSEMDIWQNQDYEEKLVRCRLSLSWDTGKWKWRCKGDKERVQGIQKWIIRCMIHVSGSICQAALFGLGAFVKQLTTAARASNEPCVSDHATRVRPASTPDRGLGLEVQGISLH